MCTILHLLTITATGSVLAFFTLVFKITSSKRGEVYVCFAVLCVYPDRPHNERKWNYEDLVHGMEYGFGAHEYPSSGVFEVEPRSCPGFIFRRSIPLGHISLLPSEFRIFIENTASEYHGDTYHLISKNCNHFTNDISLRLTGKQIPGWVNRLAGLGAVCSCLLPECLQMTTVKQLPEYYRCSEEDGSESSSTNTPRDPTESDETDQERHLLSPSSGEVSFIKEARKSI